MCNGSATHTVANGTLLTYSCHYVYRGTKAEPIVWEGPGVTGHNVHHKVNQSSQEINADCYEGKPRLLHNILYPYRMCKFVQ